MTTMELNKETAMRLWTNSFGKETSVTDFAGRKIVKGAYNDRNSKFGWNVDHILPQSKGGKTNDANLIVCHISTNDEKANKFPCFTANNKKFEILKVQNHYEIKTLSNTQEKEQEEVTNFFDHSSGIRLFNTLQRKKQKRFAEDEARFIGSVFITLCNVKDTTIIDFIEEIFDEEHISFFAAQSHWQDLVTLIIKNYDIPLKEDLEAMLDKCVLLNTYLNYYFKEKNFIEKYEIKFRVDCFNDDFDLYLKDNAINWCYLDGSKDFFPLKINNLVICNTRAKEKVAAPSDCDAYTGYDYIYTKLSEDLGKEASKR